MDHTVAIAFNAYAGMDIGRDNGETGALVSLLVWLAFGAIAVVPAFESLTWHTVRFQ